MTLQDLINNYEESPQAVYVIRLIDDRILYLNQTARLSYDSPDLSYYTGKRCYEVLRGSANPCAICPVKKLSYDSDYVWDYYSPGKNMMFRLRDRLIDVDDQVCHLKIVETTVQLPSEADGQGTYFSDYTALNESMRMSLYESDPNRSIDILLEYMGRMLEVDRAMIAERTDDGTFHNTYEWCRYGVSSLKNVEPARADALIAYWKEKTIRQEIVEATDFEELKAIMPNVYEAFHAAGVESLILYPLWKREEVSGFIAFQNARAEGAAKVYASLKTMGHFIESLFLNRDLVEKLEYLSTTDQLTGLGNRYAFKKLLNKLDLNQSLGVVFCDVTGLKRVNDEQGHGAGDMLLRDIADSLRQAFPREQIYRVGGDEYLVLLPERTETDVEAGIRDLRQIVDEKHTPLAIGSTWIEELGTTSLNAIVDIADKAMYADKEAYYKLSKHDRRRS